MRMEKLLLKKHWNAYKEFIVLLTDLDNGVYNLNCSDLHLKAVISQIDLGLYNLQNLLEIEGNTRVTNN